jgi:Spy/CpxP family protein refolding chaperone
MKRLPNLILIISLAFNVAFVAAFGFAYLGGASMAQKDTAAAPGASRQPWWAGTDLGLSEQLTQQVQEIDKRVAERRAQLLDLIARDDAPPAQVGAVLDEIDQLQREAQQLVVNSLISKQAVLGTQQKQIFYRHLRDRMHCNWDERGWRGRWGGDRWDRGRGWDRRNR